MNDAKKTVNSIFNVPVFIVLGAAGVENGWWMNMHLTFGFYSYNPLLNKVDNNHNGNMHIILIARVYSKKQI